MSRPRVLTFRAALRWFTPVWRDIEILESQTLVVLHNAIQRAFVWYNDHLYSFFLSGREWDPDSEYTTPAYLEENEPPPAALKHHPFFKIPKSAATTLRRLNLRKGQKLAYVYDFGDNISVTLHLREIAPAKNVRYPRVVALRGFSPEQYNYAEGKYSSKINRRLTAKILPIVKVAGSGRSERDLLLEWSDTSERYREE
jgi:hypothetical protein